MTLGILAWLAIAAFALPALGLRDAWGGPVLFVLLALVLLENVRRGAQPASSSRASVLTNVRRTPHRKG